MLVGDVTGRGTGSGADGTARASAAGTKAVGGLGTTGAAIALLAGIIGSKDADAT